MSTIGTVPDKVKEGQRRRKKDDGNRKGQIKLVSSLGEGKLLDKFQSSLNEKDKKKKSRERGDKMRKVHKEKRDRDIAKFKAEIDALLEEDSQPLKQSEKMSTFVPKLKGTVKGKFEEMEQKKQEGEKKKAENERKKRNERDQRERKRIEIELAKKKLEEGGQGDKDDIELVTITRGNKKPGKLNSSFEEMTKMREDKERKKAELEKQLQLEAERRKFREINTKQNNEAESEDEQIIKKSTRKRDKPRRLTTNFDEIARAHAEEQQRKADEERKQRLEEEKQRFRIEKMGNKESESESQEEGSCEKIIKPNRLATSLTNFDVLEKERMEEERKRIQERRKKLLEKEMKIFEETKNSMRNEEGSSSEEENVKKNSRTRKPRKLNSSFTKFDLVTRQNLQEEREKIHREREKLLEDEKKIFAEQRKNMDTDNDSSESTSSEVNSDLENRNSEKVNDENGEKTMRQKKKLTKRRKKKKIDRTPSKLDRSKLKFDVLERQRMEKQRWKIQEQRRKLLEEEKKIFEESRKQQMQEDADGDGENKDEKVNQSPSKLDYAKTRFDIMAQHKMEEDRKRIREERARLLREEKVLFEKEREKVKEEEQEETEVKDSEKIRKKPSRLDKSFTDFDVLARKKKEEETAKIMEESKRKLEEEKKMFREARMNMEEDEESLSTNETSNSEKRRKPQKLSKVRTDFDILEKRRLEDERNRAYEEKSMILEEEKKLFAEAKKIQNDESSDEKDSEDDHHVSKPNRLSSTLTNFEMIEEQRVERARSEAHERKNKEMEEEVERFKEERKLLNDSDIEERSGTPTPQVKQPRPKKLSFLLTNFDEIEKRRQEEERRKLKQKKDEELAEERRIFRESKQALYQRNDDSEDETTEAKQYRPIKKLNVRQQMEAVLQAQREVENKRIMESKFCRMTVEQQEMYLDKERRLQLLKEKLARAQADEDDDYETESSGEYDDESEEEEERDDQYCSQQHEEEDEYGSQTVSEDEEETDEEEAISSQSSSRCDTSRPGSNDSGYTGSPWFTQTLTNMTLTEGAPVRFDAVIQAEPHPKVTWYFKNRVIRNSPDYQYINKGTQYSLYMNESFVDDMGEYMCKAENDKGTATSKAILTVIENEE